MHLRAELDADVPVAALYAWVDDLDDYPAWLDLVRSAVAEPASEANPDPAWDVVLVGRLGPLRRLKRLRMVRAEVAAPHRVRFVRQERDGRSHASWELGVQISAAPGGSHLSMDLTYSGSLFGPPLQRLLANEIEASKPRLLALARAGVSS